jgi:hypothetical protein
MSDPTDAAIAAFFRCPVCGRHLLDCVPDDARDGDEVICPDGDHTGKSVGEWRRKIPSVTDEIAAGLMDEEP